MSLSPILQGDFPLGTNGAKQAVGHSPLQWHGRAIAYLLPGLAFEECCDHLLFGNVAVVALHFHQFTLLIIKDLMHFPFRHGSEQAQTNVTV